MEVDDDPPVNRVLDLNGVDDDDDDDDGITFVKVVKKAPARSSAATTPAAPKPASTRGVCSDVHPKGKKPSVKKPRSRSDPTVRPAVAAPPAVATPSNVLPREKSRRLPHGWNVALERKYPLPPCRCCPNDSILACLKRASPSAETHPNEYYYACFTKKCKYWALAKDVHEFWPHDAKDTFSRTQW